MSKAKNRIDWAKPCALGANRDTGAMSQTLIFHKPYGVLPQFSDKAGRAHLGDFVCGRRLPCWTSGPGQRGFDGAQ